MNFLIVLKNFIKENWLVFIFFLVIIESFLDVIFIYLSKTTNLRYLSYDSILGGFWIGGYLNSFLGNIIQNSFLVIVIWRIIIFVYLMGIMILIRGEKVFLQAIGWIFLIFHIFCILWLRNLNEIHF